MGDLKNFGKALTGGVIGLATSAFNHRLAEKSAQQQYNRQLDFWQKQNEYNHPARQRRRLEQAGLNPVAAINGIAGNNTAGQLSSVPGNEVAQRGAIDLGALNNSLSLLGQLESVGANTDLMKKQVELSAIEMLIKNAQKEGIEIDNATKEELKKWIPREKLASIFEALSRISNNNESAKNIAEDTRGKKILNDEKQEARDQGINTFVNEDRASDDAHQAALDAHNLAVSNKELIDARAAELKFSNELNKKYAEAERILDYNFKQLQGDLNKQAQLSGQSAATSGWLDDVILTNYGVVVSDLDPLLQPYYRYLAAKLSSDWTPNSPEAKKFWNGLSDIRVKLFEYELRLRDGEYISAKDRAAIESDQKRLDNETTKLLDDIGSSITNDLIELMKI